MLKYQRNDAKPPLPTVQPQEVENYTPHAFTSVDGGKMIFGKRLVSNPEGVPLLEDSEIKAHSLLGESGFILERNATCSGAINFFQPDSKNKR